MARTWPTVAQLQHMLYGAGVLSAIPPTGLQASTIIDYQGALDAAREEFERLATIKPFLADGSEAQIQYLQFSGSPTGGTVKLSYAGVVMAGTFAYNGTAADLQTALTGLSSIGAGLATVTGDAGGPYTITFDSSLAPYSWILLNTNSLTGGTSPNITVDEPEQFEDSPQGALMQLSDTYFSIRQIYSNRSVNNDGVLRTHSTEYEYIYRRNSKAIDGIRWYGYQGGWGWQTAQGGYGHEFGIIGRRGFSDDLPADVFKAILAGAALQSDLMPIFAAKKSGAGTEWKEGDVSEKYGPMGAWSGLFTSWQTLFEETACRYKRMRVYGA